MLWAGIDSYVVLFVVLFGVAHTEAEALSPMIVLTRAFASLAFVMLTIVLAIGPLCRLDPRFLPLLYKRRHLGVSMFVVA